MTDSGDDAMMSTITVSGNLARRVRAARGEASGESLEGWCRGALEYFLDEHRSGKIRVDPYRHDSRRGGDYDRQVGHGAILSSDE